MSDTPNETPAPSTQKKKFVDRLREWSSLHPFTVGFVLGFASSLMATIVFYVLVESRNRDLSLYVQSDENDNRESRSKFRLGGFP
jgi:hypothetical protein